MSRREQAEFSFDDRSQDESPPDEAEDSGTAGDESHEGPALPFGPDEGSPLQSLIDYNFLQYASYVIRERAIPDLADGLKPVQRRILHSLHDKDDGRFVKVANIVGHTMQYHPHGDASIADALVTLVNKSYLIEGQGNFGNIYTGDSAAAPRYIECRLTPLAREELFNRDLTEYVPSYDGRNKEPVVLPSKLPLVLMLGVEGIAVGLATRIYPHNFPELLEAQIAILRKKPFKVYPDFPQGGLMDVSQYDKGAGFIRVRAKVVEKGPGKLVVTELPPGQTTETLINSIEDAVRKKKVPVKSITDFTAADVEIQLDLAQGAKPAKAVSSLYAFTLCETKLSSNVVLIHENKPVEMTVDRMLRELTKRLVALLKRELEIGRHRLLEEFHAKTLIRIFIENRIYKRIEECKTYAAVQKAVLAGLKPFRSKLRRAVTTGDVEMLLGIRIKRISRFDINRNKEEIEKILSDLATVEKDLKKLSAYTIRYLQGLLRKYGAMYPRRTRITTFEEIAVKELTASELRLCYDVKKGYLGSDIEGKQVLECSSLDRIVLVWKDGRYRVVEPPQKLFVDGNLIYCAKADRDRTMTMVYKMDGLTYLKRFAFGGSILNKDYLCTPEESRVLLFDDSDPENIYVKYRPAKGQRIHQQVFAPGEVPVKGAKARGNRMTAKSVAAISTSRARWWDEKQAHRGVFM